MKKLKMNLELSNLGEKTHIWFPLPQLVCGEPKEWLNPIDFKIVADKKFGNQSAYFITNEPGIRISAAFLLSDNRESGNKNPKIFLQSNPMVQSDSPAIKNIAKYLFSGVSGDNGKAKKCFDWVIGYLEYANPIRGLYSSIQALTDRKVDCGGFSTLLVALLRAAKIPARCVFGWAVESKYGYHAWAEFFDKKKHSWIPCDPSVAHLGNRTKLDAGFGFINDKRVIFSVGEDLELTGDNIKWNIPLLQSPVVVPLDDNGIPTKFFERLIWSVV
ncbi:transglutaminase domain-containing protein [Candidatus Collierbacteria bacterium]|nr:transglutaminase domain-containing protein [Candidatus Collierbacteria bacterium]